MVNLPHINPISLKLKSVSQVIEGNNESYTSKPRKRMGNKGFVRSDLWTSNHGYSYNTVNKYRGKLYGDEMFLHPTPSTGGKIRIHNDVADLLREHGVRPRGTVNRAKPATTPGNIKSTTELPDKVAESWSELVGNHDAMRDILMLGVMQHGTSKMLEMLVDVDQLVGFAMAHDKMEKGITPDTNPEQFPCSPDDLVATS